MLTLKLGFLAIFLIRPYATDTFVKVVNFFVALFCVELAESLRFFRFRPRVIPRHRPELSRVIDTIAWLELKIEHSQSRTSDKLTKMRSVGLLLFAVFTKGFPELPYSHLIELTAREFEQTEGPAPHLSNADRFWGFAVSYAFFPSVSSSCPFGDD